MFGFGAYGEYLSDTDRMLSKGADLLLGGRCAPVFEMLFGVSFFFILRKPTYSGWKFLWRCLVLLLIGLVNKLFFNGDILMWYSIWGMALLSFRYASPKVLLASAIGLLLLSALLVPFHVGDMLFPSNNELKYVVGDGGGDVRSFFSYPLWESVKAQLRHHFNKGIFDTFSHFLLGYWFARKGYIFDLKRYSRIRFVFAFGIAYFVLFMCYFFLRLPFFLLLCYLCGALFMAVLFLHIYFKIPRHFSFLEYYGRLGLTNYTTQSLFGVFFMVLVAIPCRLSMPVTLLASLCFYAVQCLFSLWWLRRFTNGPLEWLWRCLTNKKFVSPLKVKE